MPPPGVESIASDSLRAFWWRAAVFLAGMAVLVVLLGRLDRYADVEVVGPKLTYFARNRADYDTLFIGSSLTHRGVSPAVYDAELAGRGRASRSFNFGALGMVPPESYFLLEKVLALRPPNLRYVFLEVEEFQLAAKRVHTRRFDYWHSPRYAALVVRAIWASGGPWRAKLHQSELHLEAALRRLFLVGRGPALTAALIGPSLDLAALGPDRDGWLSTEDDVSNRMIQRRAAVAELDDEDRARPGPLPQGRERRRPEEALAALEVAVARVRVAGAEPILLAMPRSKDIDALVALVRTRIDAPLLDLNDPDRYPALFEPGNRFDSNHMNRPGAALLSRLLAGVFAETEGF